MRFEDDVVELGDHLGHRVVNALGAVVAVLRDGRDGVAESESFEQCGDRKSLRDGAILSTTMAPKPPPGPDCGRSRRQ